MTHTRIPKGVELAREFPNRAIALDKLSAADKQALQLAGVENIIKADVSRDRLLDAQEAVSWAYAAAKPAQALQALDAVFQRARKAGKLVVPSTGEPNTSGTFLDRLRAAAKNDKDIKAFVEEIEKDYGHLKGKLIGKTVDIVVSDVATWGGEYLIPRLVAELGGATVRTISPGGVPAVDPTSVSEKWVSKGESKAVKMLRQDPAFVRAQSTTAAVSQEPGDVLIFAGGHGPGVDVRFDDAALRMVKEAYAANRPMAFICHGPVVLAEAVKRGLVTLGENDKVTAYPAEAEYDAFTSPTGEPINIKVDGKVLPEFNSAVDFGKHYDIGPSGGTDPSVHYKVHVVTAREGKLVTAKNPASAGPATRALFETLLESKPPLSTKAVEALMSKYLWAQEPEDGAPIEAISHGDLPKGVRIGVERALKAVAREAGESDIEETYYAVFEPTDNKRLVGYALYTVYDNDEQTERTFNVHGFALDGKLVYSDSDSQSY